MTYKSVGSVLSSHGAHEVAIKQLECIQSGCMQTKTVCNVIYNHQLVSVQVEPSPERWLGGEEEYNTHCAGVRKDDTKDRSVQEWHTKHRSAQCQLTGVMTTTQGT